MSRLTSWILSVEIISHFIDTSQGGALAQAKPKGIALPRKENGRQSSLGKKAV